MINEKIFIQEPFLKASHNVIDALRRQLKVNTIFIAANDTVTNLVLKAYNEAASLVEEGTRLPFEDSYCRLVCANGRLATVIPDTTADPLTARLCVTEKLGKGAFIGVPLQVENEQPFGTICAIDVKPRVFTEEEVSTLQAMGVLLSRIVQLEMERFSDPLTKAYNRSFLEMYAQIHDLQLNPTGALLLDLDRFKEVNREYGRNFGDRLLQQTVGIIEKTCGESAYIIRLHNDQFAALLQEATLNRLVTRAQAILAGINRIALPLGGSVTGSVGLALSNDKTRDINDLLHRADIKMLSVKHRSGNGYAY